MKALSSRDSGNGERRKQAQQQARSEIGRYVHLRSYGPLIFAMPVAPVCHVLLDHVAKVGQYRDAVGFAISLLVGLFISESVRWIYLNRSRR